MAFCVECGHEGPTFESVCAEDFQRKHTLLRVPEALDLVRCVHCGKVHVRDRWIRAEVNDVVPDLLQTLVERDPGVARVRFSYSLRPQDARNIAVTIEATCVVGPWELATSLATRVRVQNGACPTCSKQKGRFFIGTVQVRAEDRTLTEGEMERARTLVVRSGSGEEFVTSVEDVRGGFDVRVSSNAFARRLARELGRALGGTVGSSATLHTQKEGEEQYRATYVVRLPGFREGDELAWRRGRYRVVGIGETVRLQNRESGEHLHVRARELRSARVVKK